MKPFWITFYSYKGGVGRSLALANTAALLVERGRRVVLIDFDLEAPGLDSFQEFKSVVGKPGVVEYVTQFKNTKRAPEIGEFTHLCELPGHLRGKLWIMPAGTKDSAYNSCRERLKWAELYEFGRGEPFVENWKAAVARHCQPDYVFVDSRTGLTDVGGICTLHLPDLVVMVFGLNEQNVCGVAAVAKTIRESDFKHVPQLHYVASPVPNLPRDAGGALAKRWAAATAHLGTKIESSIRYQATAALSERLFVLEDQLEASPLVFDYKELLNRLIDFNRNGLDFLSGQTTQAISDGDTILMEKLNTILQEEYPNRAEALMAQAQLKQGLGDPAIATTLAQQALQLDPTYQTPYDWLLKQYRRANKFDAALALCNSVLKCADQLSARRLGDLHSNRGEMAMAAGNYKDAATSFQYCMNAAQKRGGDPITILVHGFNAMEALRRQKENYKPEVWKHVTELFDKAGETTATPLIFQANRWQAMHVAFAIVGDRLRAREALLKARGAAELLGLAEDIFTVKNYTNVPVKEWLKINDEMLAALDRGELWDGMPLPVAKPAEDIAAGPSHQPTDNP